MPILGKIRAIFNIFGILCLAIAIFSVTVRFEAKGAEQVIFEDDFESYDVGTFPSSGGWDLWFNGAGDSYQTVVDSVADSPTKSLKLLEEEYWGAFAAWPIEPLPEMVGFEVCVRVEDLVMGEDIHAIAIVGFAEKLDAGHCCLYSSVRFIGNGTIVGGGHFLQPYVADRWYKIRYIINRQSETFSVWIDDILMLDNMTVRNSAGDAYRSTSKIQALTVGQYSHPVNAYFDDVKVFSLGDISEVQTYPIANFVWSPNKPNSGENTLFDASASQPGRNDTQTVPIASYAWDFGDNTTATGESVDHAYALPGNYTVILTVSNILGQQSIRQKKVTVGTSVLSLSASSSTSLIGFQVSLEGTLTFDGNPVVAAPVQMVYSTNDGNSWNEITSSDTNVDGQYSAIWLPSATGNYIVRAKWEGNDTFPEVEAVANLAVIPSTQQNTFSVVSNSTISNLAYNSTSNELSFTVSGSSYTIGYTNVFISKTILSNPTDLAVSLDGKQLEYTVTSLTDSWKLQFIYLHSTHTVVISIPETATTSTSSSHTNTYIVAGIIIVIIVVAAASIIILKKRK